MCFIVLGILVVRNIEKLKNYSSKHECCTVKMFGSQCHENTGKYSTPLPIIFEDKSILQCCYFRKIIKKNISYRFYK